MRTAKHASKLSRTPRPRLPRKAGRSPRTRDGGITLVLPDGVRLQGLRRQTIIDLLLSL